VPDRRIIVHPSPIWDLDPGPGTTIESAQSEVQGLVRRVEVVTDDGQTSGLATVRLVVAAP
jgi:hypothetical protein